MATTSTLWRIAPGIPIPGAHAAVSRRRRRRRGARRSIAPARDWPPAAWFWLTTIALIALAPVGGMAQTPPLANAAAVETIAELVVETPPPAPLFFGIAHVIVPPGTIDETAGTAGPRIIAIESGTLTIATDGTATVLRATAYTPQPLESVPLNSEIVLGPGDRFLASESAIRHIRNEGTRPSVYLDTALFPPGPGSISPAFTTPEGISFQLLAGVIAETVPDAPLQVTLSRMRLPANGALPTSPRDGPALIYVEAGSLDLEAVGGAIHYSRSAAPTPSSTAGPMRPVRIGDHLNLAAGASAYLELGSSILASNQRDVPVTLLMVELGPA